MSAEEERAARKARILARGADRMALVRGERKVLPTEPGAAAHAPLSAVVEARSAEHTPAAADAELPVPPVLPEKTPAAPLVTEGASADQPPVAQPELGSDGLRQRVATAPTAVPPMPTVATGSAVIRSAATPSLLVAPPGSAVARAAQAARLRSVRSLRPCIVGVAAPVLCGVLVAALWTWGCDGRPVLAASVAGAAARAGVLRGVDFGAAAPAALEEAAAHLLQWRAIPEGGELAEPLHSRAAAGIPSGASAAASSSSSRWLLEQRFGSLAGPPSAPAPAPAAAAALARDDMDAVVDLGGSGGRAGSSSSSSGGGGAWALQSQWWRSDDAAAALGDGWGAAALTATCRLSDPSTAAAPPALLPLVLIGLVLLRAGLEAAFRAAERALSPAQKAADPARVAAAAAAPLSPPVGTAAAASAAARTAAPRAGESADDRMLSAALAEVMGDAPAAAAGRSVAPPAVLAGLPAGLSALLSPHAPGGASAMGGQAPGLLSLALRHGPALLAAAQFGGRIVSDACTCVLAFVCASAVLEASQ